MKTKRQQNEELRKAEEAISKLTYPLTPDRTSIEVHYSRSKRMREAIWKTLWAISIDELKFPDFIEMINVTANEAKCSYETAHRWIRQYTSKNGDFELFDNDRRVKSRKSK